MVSEELLDELAENIEHARWLVDNHKRTETGGPRERCPICEAWWPCDKVMLAALAVKQEAENARLRERVAALDVLLAEPLSPTWTESVPIGVRWFCGECVAMIDGFAETEQDQADAAMLHDAGCRWTFAKRLRAALTARGEAAS